MIIYGIKEFIKNLGFYGPATMCDGCQTQYKKWIVRTKKWMHIMFIPLFPIKTEYKLVCPMCCKMDALDKKVAKQYLAQPDMNGQNIQIAFYHHVGNDQGYEVWVTDYNTNIQKCVMANLNKYQLNNVKRNLGFKNYPTTEIQ